MKKVLFIQNKILHYRIALYNELAKHYDITVLHSGQKTITDMDSYKEIQTKTINFGTFKFQSSVISEVKKDKYDVIISMFDLHWINNILAMYLHKKKTKFIWWGTWLTGNKIADRIKLFLTNHEYSSIFYNQEAKESFIRLGVDEKKLFVANNTFDVGERIKCYEFNTKNNILFVGSLNKRKQLDILINAFFNIADKLPNFVNLIIIGDGEELDELQKLVKKIKLEDRIIFLGKITDNNKLIEFYKKAIVSVSYGQAGLTVLQSFGFGVPFITKINAISGGEKTNIKHGENGLFCEDNILSLKENLLKVCTNIKYAKLLGRNAYNYYGNYCTIENMAKGFINAIELI